MGLNGVAKAGACRVERRLLEWTDLSFGGLVTPPQPAPAERQE